MNELELRLIRCISSIFPELTETEIRTWDASLAMEIDSLAAVTLVALLDEEFGVDLDFNDLLTLGTFTSIEEYLATHGVSIAKEEGFSIL
jgi:acyl carrier protein